MVGPSPAFPFPEAGLDAKKLLRRNLRAARADHVASQPDSIKALLFLRPPAPVLDLLPEGTTIGLYHALGDEAPTLGWARWLYENGRKLALPWFAGRNAAMEFRAWDNPFDDDALVSDPWGARQPPDRAPRVTPTAQVVPLLGFDSDCQRIGQGAGHYDRWLATHPGTTTIGLAWDCQLVNELPLEDHDMPLDAIVTPTRFYRRSA